MDECTIGCCISPRVYYTHFKYSKHTHGENKSLTSFLWYTKGGKSNKEVKNLFSSTSVDAEAQGLFVCNFCRIFTKCSKTINHPFIVDPILCRFKCDKGNSLVAERRKKSLSLFGLFRIFEKSSRLCLQLIHNSGKLQFPFCDLDCAGKISTSNNKY